MEYTWLASRQEPELLLSSNISRSDLALTRLPVKWVPAGSFIGEKVDGPYNVPSSSTVVKNAWSYTTTLPHLFMACTETTVPLVIYFLLFPFCKFLLSFLSPAGFQMNLMIAQCTSYDSHCLYWLVTAWRCCVAAMPASLSGLQFRAISTAVYPL